MTCEGRCCDMLRRCYEAREAERPRWAGRKLSRAGVHSRAPQQQAGLSEVGVGLSNISEESEVTTVTILSVSLKPPLR